MFEKQVKQSLSLIDRPVQQHQDKVFWQVMQNNKWSTVIKFLEIASCIELMLIYFYLKMK